MNFYYRKNAEKNNDQILQETQETLILAHFPRYWAKNIFKTIQNTSYRFRTQCQNSDKTNNQMPRKRLGGRTDGRTDGKVHGRTDGQTLFHRTLQSVI